VEIAEQAEGACARATEQLTVEAVGLGVRGLTVALGEGPELLGVTVALRRELLAHRMHVVLVGVTAHDRPERVAQPCLGSMQEREVVGEVHVRPPLQLVPMR
jgi:hypothetical protein